MSQIDRLRWQAEKKTVKDPKYRTVTRVILEAGKVTIEGARERSEILS
jgi:hypothetical protein